MVTVIATADQAGQRRIDLPQFAGVLVAVIRRGVGLLRQDEYSSLSTGGFELDGSTPIIGEGETFFVYGASAQALSSYSDFSGNILQQYPHILTITENSISTRDVNGDWSTPTETVTLIWKCRAESNSANGYLISADGSRIDFSWIVCMPLLSQDIIIGSKMTVTDKGEIRLSDKVKRFSRDFFNSRVWL